MYSIKIGHSTLQKPTIVANFLCVPKFDSKSTYIGNHYQSLTDKTSLSISHPVQKGYITNWALQKDIWDYLFSSEEFDFDLKNTSVIFTEPVANFDSSRECMFEVFFEDYEMNDIFLTTAPLLSHYANLNDDSEGCQNVATLVVDSGFSFTHITPVFRGKILTEGLVRYFFPIFQHRCGW